MIKSKNLVPEVYYNRSRDFQLLGRIYDIIFNYLKTNTEIIDAVPYSEDIDDKLIPLISTTLGFKQTHEYNTQQLKVLCSSFVTILRNKGNLSSIDTLLSILSNVENTKERCYREITDDDPYTLKIYLPLSISDTALFEDMLYYVLPAGMSYRIIKELVIENEPVRDELIVSNERATLKVKANYNLVASQVTQQATNEYIEKSTDHGLGRIEDMHVIRVKDIAEHGIENCVPKNQSDIPADQELAPKTNNNAGE